MHFWGKKPSACSFLGFLKLASATKNIILGIQIHCCVLKLGFDIDSVLVLSALIDMYGKCRDIESSVDIFENVPNRTLKCCNSLMTSSLRCGLIDDVIELFGLMIDVRIGYDEVSLSSTLKALVVSAFASSTSWMRHYSCMIDLLGRVGLLHEAEQLLKEAPRDGKSAIWSSMLRSCRIHQNEQVGKRAAATLMNLEDPAAWLQASSFYSEIGDFDSETRFREVVVARKIRRDIGHILIEVHGHRQKDLLNGNSIAPRKLLDNSDGRDSARYSQYYQSY
ncbi:unnamed protein product [Fraxinus pennsylvanica]|uniref:Pentatricopeptide repeat-containing protein n=1 Tax=Fraxinus pennsylvanica TaxID=56036 RepID=A0AAD1ZSG8_9LAMI|nr:unnamed protein product [Fraxinus pennsylvanica]